MFAGLCVVCVIGVVIMGAIAWNNPEVQRGVAAAGAGMELGARGAMAPGAQMLQRRGCTQAMVFDRALMEEFVDTLHDPNITIPEVPAQPVVNCSLGDGVTLGCDEATETYRDATTEPPEQVGVTIYRFGTGESVCSGLYNTAEAERVRDLEGSELFWGDIGRPPRR